MFPKQFTRYQSQLLAIPQIIMEGQLSHTKKPIDELKTPKSPAVPDGVHCQGLCKLHFTDITVLTYTYCNNTALRQR